MIFRTLLFCSIAISSTNGFPQTFHNIPAPSPEQGSIFIYPERLPMNNGSFTTVHRGMLFAPLNRTKRDSDVVAIEFYRFPRSANADPKTPPIFILHGGPGFAGLGDRIKKRGAFEDRFLSQTDISDIIVIGQRGIGSSKPDTVIDQTVKPQPSSQPRDEAKAVEDFQKVLSREREYWLEEGVDLSGFNAVEAAADVRDLAKGLGYQQIIIRGTSFGSHWGMTVLRNHPKLVARAVLGGMEGPDHTWDHPGWIWNVYKRVAKDAESSEALKDMIPDGGLISAAESLAAKVSEKPITVTLDEGESWEKKVVIDQYAMGQIFQSVDLKDWPALIIDMNSGNLDKAARRFAMRKMRPPSARDLSTASYWMLDSGSGISAKRREEYESDPAMAIIGSTYWHYAAGSPAWKTDLGDDFRSPFSTEVPTLIVHGTWDTSTPYENAEELAPYFKNGTFVTVRRGSHGALIEAINSSQEFVNAYYKFLTTGDASDVPKELKMPVPKWKTPS